MNAVPAHSTSDTQQTSEASQPASAAGVPRLPILGFVGVGQIAESVIRALFSGPNARALSVVLSPRSAARSAALAAKFEGATVASSNQDVVDVSDIVFIGVLPEQMAELCSSLTFRADQTVVSLVAGWPPSSLTERVAPATTVCQMIPLPMIELGVGPVVLHPEVSEVAALFEGCGEIVGVEREDQILAFNGLSSTLSLFFELQNTLIDWAHESRGIDRQLATSYVTSMFHGLATESLGASADAMPSFPVAHETPGGLNAQLRQAMINEGTMTALATHLEHIYQTRRMDTAEAEQPGL